MPRTGRAGTPVFATTPYEANADGVLRAVLPTRCVFAAPAEEGCRVGVRHYRERATGPCFAIAVVRCASHPQHSFTLYPPGHVPYGRTSVVDVATTGTLRRDGDVGRLAWQGSLFGAALDAAGGIRWPAGSPASDDRRRRTQGRRVDAAGRLLGVQPGVTERQREQIATCLDVPTMTLRTAAAMWSTCWTTHGKAIMAILVAIVVDGSILDRLLGAGHLGGVWPRPHRWEPRGSSWLVGRSPASERSPEITVLGRGPPPTNSPVAGLRCGESPSDP